MTSRTMQVVIESVLPALGDPTVLTRRQGAIEALHIMAAKCRSTHAC